MENLENKYFRWIVNKTYFDSFAHEFRDYTMDKKLLTLALYLENGGDLHYAIDSYKEDRSEHTLSSLTYTLLYYIEYLRTGEGKGTLQVLLEDFLSEHQIIDLLAAELKARLGYSYESNEDYSVMKIVYEIKIGGFDLEAYLEREDLTSKELIISIIKGDLSSDFDIGNIKKINELD